jgi:branched-chain amino acid aminotransferase
MIPLMNECFGKKFIINGELQDSEVFDQSLVYEGQSVYEVIRMVKGTPLFFNDHMERLSASLSLQGREQLADSLALKKSIITLLRSDKKKETNIKIVFNFNNNRKNYLIYFIESIYPTEEQFRMGVKGVLFFAERKDPESKVINNKLRSAICSKLIYESAYEALLVNEQNRITEGSRSNIFFLRGDVLVTAEEKVILSGITRKHIIALCNDNGIKVEYSCVSVSDIADYDAVFMTGTSPMVLPFYCIDNVRFNVSHPLMKRLRKLYLEKADESMKLFRS